MVSVVGFDKSVNKRRTCGNCSAILEYVPAEIKEKLVSDYTGDTDRIRYICCPRCNKELKV